MTNIIQNNNKREYIKELLMYGDPPDLEDLQCLNLLVDTLQPHMVQSFITHILDTNGTVSGRLYLKGLSDQQMRELTIRDIGFTLQSINSFNLLKGQVPWFWIKIYLKRYKKLKKELWSEVFKRRRFINKLLQDERVKIRNLNVAFTKK